MSDPNASNFIPADRHKHLYAGEKIPRRRNALDAPKGKAALQRTSSDLPPLSPETGSSDESILGRLRMLAAVDERLGRLLTLLEQSGDLDRTLIEYFSDKVFPRIHRMGYQAVRTQRWKHIHYTELPGMDELYDLQTDPYEMTNLAGNPMAKAMLEEMQSNLNRLVRETGAR